MQKRDALFLIPSNVRRLKYKDKWYDVFCDPIIDELEKNEQSYLVIERSSELMFKYPRYRKSLFIQPEIVKVFIKSLFKSKFIKLDGVFLKEYNKLKELLANNHLNDSIISLKDIIKESSYISELSKYFLRSLKIIQPKKVYTVPWYGYVGMALCYACNKQDLPVYDIQHGVQGKYHYAYGTWCNIPSSGYNTHPTNYLNWSKEDSENINQWLEKSNLNKSAEVKGNPTQEIFLRNTDISLYYDKIFNEKYKDYKHYKKILITMQKEKSCPQYILDLLNKSDSNILWLIRFHPGTDARTRKVIKNKIKQLNKENYEFDFATESPVYCLLRNIDLHITKSSSVVIEAAKFGVKSIIISEHGKLYYKSYIKNNIALYCRDINKILYNIKSHKIFNNNYI